MKMVKELIKPIIVNEKLSKKEIIDQIIELQKLCKQYVTEQSFDFLSKLYDQNLLKFEIGSDNKVIATLYK